MTRKGLILLRATNLDTFFVISYLILRSAFLFVIWNKVNQTSTEMLQISVFVLPFEIWRVCYLQYKEKNFMHFIFTENKIFTHLPSFVLITTTTSSKLFLSQNKNTFYSTNSLQYKAHTSMIRIMCTLNDTNASKGRINFLFSWFRWEKFAFKCDTMQHLMIPL